MNIFAKIDNKLYLSLNPWFRVKWRNPRLRKRLTNKDVVLLCNNCNGACILHDLNLPFKSPFVNLWMLPSDFLRYCNNIRHYRDRELCFLPEETKKFGYPVALLDDVKIYSNIIKVILKQSRNGLNVQKEWNMKTYSFYGSPKMDIQMKI